MIKILTIDDIYDNLVVSNALLEEAFPDVQLLIAQSGKKGIELCIAEKPDVVLLDIVMPIMDGYEVCRRLKADEILKHIPVIMVTASRTDKASRIKALEVGADAFLTKPLDESELKAQIRAMLRIRESEERQLNEKAQLEKLVHERTKALEKELAEHKRTEAALRESEKLLRISFDQAPSGAAIASLDCRFIRVNEVLCKITGYSPEELTQLRYTDITHPDDMEINLDLANQLANGLIDQYSLEKRYIRKDGQIIWVFLSSRVVKDDDGNSLYVLGTIQDITDRKNAELALKKSEQTLETLISNLPGFVYRCRNDHDWTMEFLSDGCIAVTGYTSEELLSNKIKSFNDIIHPDYRESLWESWQKTLNSKLPFEESYQIIHKDGTPRWVWEKGQGIFSEDRELLYLEGFIQDITTTKQAEEALKESEDKFRTLAESAPFAIMIYQNDYWVYANQAAEKICGYTSQELYNMLFWEFIDESFKATIEQKGKAREISKEADNSYEFKIKTKEGTQKWVFLTGSSIIYKGRPAGIISVVDITERKRAEEIQKVMFAISNAVILTKDIKGLIFYIREQLSMLIDTTNFAVVFYNEDSGMLSAPYFEDEKDRIDSWPLEKSITGYVIKQNRPMLLSKQQINDLESRGEIIAIGTICEVWLGVPLHIEGKVIGAFVVQSYDNPLAYNENDLEMLDFISHQISISIQRKQDIQNLRIALSKAEESDRLKTAFLSNMSHEIRTPMNGIIGFSELLDDDYLSGEERKQYTQIINTNGKHLLSIINDIVDIAKIDSNQLAINKDWFYLNHLLDELLISYDNEKIIRDKKNISFILEKEFEDSQSLILTDDVRLRQILLNLLGNALKFTKEGFIKFGYSLQNDKLCFFVQDTGKGVAKEKQTIIFERFRQEEETYTRQFGGTGLGLTISKGLVELLGGKMWLVSDEGKGASFFFTIPYNIPDADSLNFDNY
ncbi:MAG: PAS domain S-box protein [Bacteroidetes bacterium]|nr:PAS domain S-box protein [Bacteroidota bacterium]